MSTSVNVREYIDRYPFDLDCHWDAEDFSFDTLSAPVVRIHFCAAANDNDTDTVVRRQPVNHWMVFLQTGATTSVRLSISSGETSAYPAVIELASKRYIVSHFSPIVISSAVNGGVTVEAVFRLLIAKGRDRYKFTDQHVGCRWWCYCIAHDFESAGWVERGTANRVGQAASWYYPQLKNRDKQGSANNEPVACPMEQGVFFWFVKFLHVSV